MRIAIPSDDKLTLAAHAGRAQGFMIYDITDGQAIELEFRTHSPRHGSGGHEHRHRHGDGGEHHEHGHNHSHRGLLDKLEDCSLVIAGGMGPRLVNDLNAHNIEVQFTHLHNISEIADTLAAGSFVNNNRGSTCRHHRHSEPESN